LRGPLVRVHRSRLTATSVRANVDVGSRSFDVGFSTDVKVSPNAVGDIWLPIALLVAMSVGGELHLDDRVSRRLMTSTREIQDIFATWFPTFRRAPITAPLAGRDVAVRPRPVVMQSFTGGVDSYYTLLTNPDVSKLLYLHDLLHDTEEVRDRMRTHLADAAAQANRELVQIDYDVRTMLDEFAEWGLQAHGAVIAAAAAFVARGQTTMLIPASHSYLELYPHGSHPLVDPLWSGDRLRVVHHGAFASRVMKIKQVASDADALSRLRVCWRTQTEINCSVCEKCVRTMTTLELLGRREDATTFNSTLTREMISNVVLSGESDLSFSLENLELARDLGRTEIADAIEIHIRTFQTGYARGTG
jgi:hypothetical protein